MQETSQIEKLPSDPLWSFHWRRSDFFYFLFTLAGCLPASLHDPTLIPLSCVVPESCCRVPALKRETDCAAAAQFSFVCKCETQCAEIMLRWRRQRVAIRGRPSCSVMKRWGEVREELLNAEGTAVTVTRDDTFKSFNIFKSCFLC